MEGSTASSSSSSSKPIEIWSGSQKDLFRKYASKRTKAIQDIQAALQDFKEEYDVVEQD